MTMEGSTAGFCPWIATYWHGGELLTSKFVKLTEMLKWIENSDEALGYYDPEWSASIELAYHPHEDWEPDPDDRMALVAGRFVGKMLDGWAGGGANYQVEIGDQVRWLDSEEVIEFDRHDL
jgi:hypothetical protein